ncbi:MAG: VOC family protein [Deltaproteobacteria bacterium]|nr:VOC family protein [Deltaproteobacteria bacterium]
MAATRSNRSAQPRPSGFFACAPRPAARRPAHIDAKAAGLAARPPARTIPASGPGERPGEPRWRTTGALPLTLLVRAVARSCGRAITKSPFDVGDSNAPQGGTVSKQLEPLGIKRLEGLHYYVHDLERSRRFYCDLLDFAETWHSSPEVEATGRQRSIAFEAGRIAIVCSTPLGSGGRAARFLSRHPDGVGTLTFEVEDIEHTFRLIEARGGTPIDDIATYEDDGGTLRQFSITTPFGDCTFRFRQRSGFRALFPGAIAKGASSPSEANCFGFQTIDHITSNFQTMSPALLWLEHVMGFEPMWEVAFHTSDVVPDKAAGSGLKSRVMWDPNSGVKFANNEPKRPFFKASQINVFNEELHGDGVQHAALTVTDIITAVRGLRARSVAFMPTPGTYYDMLPERIAKSGIDAIDEDIELLRELEILVDGDHHHAYLLQIFLRESSGLYGDDRAGPFFYEIIQRKGDRGFGAGNFRALFESIERQQQTEGDR